MTLLKFFHVFFACIWTGALVARSAMLTGKERATPSLCRHLYFLVNLPSMVMTIGLGVWLFVGQGLTLKAPWFHMKFLFVAILIGLDILVRYWCVRDKSIVGGWVLLGAVLMSLAGILAAIYVLKPLCSIAN